jgi:hypothetical protein
VTISNFWGSGGGDDGSCGNGGDGGDIGNKSLILEDEYFEQALFFKVDSISSFLGSSVNMMGNFNLGAKMINDDELTA